PAYALRTSTVAVEPSRRHAESVEPDAAATLAATAHGSSSVRIAPDATSAAASAAASAAPATRCAATAAPPTAARPTDRAAVTVRTPAASAVPAMGLLSVLAHSPLVCAYSQSAVQGAALRAQRNGDDPAEAHLGGCGRADEVARAPGAQPCPIDRRGDDASRSGGAVPASEQPGGVGCRILQRDLRRGGAQRPDPEQQGE